MNPLKRNLATAAAVTVLALALAACSGAATSPAPAASATQAPTAAPAARATEAPSAAPTIAAAEQATAEQPVAEPTSTQEQPTVEATAVTEAPATPAAAVNSKLNLNQASANDYLAAIPGFSNRMVREFMEYRPYVSIQQFRREIGKYVDDAQVAEYEKYVYVPVSVDESDAETLKQLPGVDDAIAAALIAGRPYGSNEAFLASLAQQVSPADLALAATFLSTP